MFKSPQDQIKNIQKWNKKYKWGFSNAAIDTAFEKKPTSDNENTASLQTSVLVPYLSGVQSTFDALIQVIRDEYKSHYISYYTKEVKLTHGTHKPGLRWETIDFGANRNKVPQDIGAEGAHAGILAAACHFPDWLKAMHGSTVPYVDLPGYRVNAPGGDPWAISPYIYVSPDGSVLVRVGWADSSFPACAEPVVVGSGTQSLEPLATDPLVLPKILTINGVEYEQRD